MPSAFFCWESQSRLGPSTEGHFGDTGLIRLSPHTQDSAELDTISQTSVRQEMKTLAGRGGQVARGGIREAFLEEGSPEY